VRSISVTLILVMANAASTADKFAVKRESVDPPTELVEGVRRLLQKDCELVTDGAGTAVGRFWFRAELPGKATAQQIKNGITFQEVTETCVLGAVKFERPFIDYRKQEIAAGVYTLRLAYQPENGDHKDSAPHTEFALLVPADKDPKPDEMEAKALYKLSFASTGGEHPGVLLLYPDDGKAKELKTQDRGSGIWTLNVPIQVASPDGKAAFGFGITIAGWSKLR
jgi:hypothetical protein